MKDIDPKVQIMLIQQLRKEFSAFEGDLDQAASSDFRQICRIENQLTKFANEKGADQDRHELINILSALLGYTEMLADEADNLSVTSVMILNRIISSLSSITQDQSAISQTAGEALVNLSSKERQISKPNLNHLAGKILAVDDTRENRDLVRRMLERNGHHVITTSNGSSALNILKKSDIDVVLLDLLMPEMDGREVLKEIKSNQNLRATPVIMISGQQDIAEIIQCIEAGADDYLFKPFNPILLDARIKAGIDRKRWHDREESYRKQLERSEKFIRTTFGRYLSENIVSEILERPEGLELGGDLREVTILMSDIRGFTKLTETLPPVEVVKMLNRYLGVMSDIVMEHNGTIDEFVGDAILAVFGAPQRRANDTDRAVSCAINMQLAMRDINADNIKDGLPTIKTGIALNTGSVIAGNIGSERRSKYGFVGYPMNVTSRIEDKTKGGEILISDSTKQKLSNEYKLSSSREIKVRGLKNPLVVHSILLHEEQREK